MDTPSHVKFDLSSQTDSPPSEDDDKIKEEMKLHKNQRLISKIYKVHWRADVTSATTDVIVPVDVPGDKPENISYYFWLRQDGVWRKESVQPPIDGIVSGQLCRVEAFAVVAELTDPRVEKMTIGPDGGKFVSKKDDRISMDFPEGALEETLDFRFKAGLVDKERYEEYIKLGAQFRCIQGLSHTLGVSPEVPLKRPAELCLPLDVDTGDNSKVIFIKWIKDKDGRKVPSLVENPTYSEQQNCYRSSLSEATASSYAPVSVAAESSNDSITNSVDYLCGRKCLCNILTFTFYDRKYKLYRLLMDCVDFYKVSGVIQLHKMDGFEEVDKSRSRDIDMTKKTRIRVSLEGNLKVFDKNVKVNSLLFDCYARTNKVMVPVNTDGEGTMSVVRYTWDRENHQVFFFLEGKKRKQTIRNRVNTGSNQKVVNRLQKDETTKSNLETMLPPINPGSMTDRKLENLSSTAQGISKLEDVTSIGEHSVKLRTTSAERLKKTKLLKSRLDLPKSGKYSRFHKQTGAKMSSLNSPSNANCSDDLSYTSTNISGKRNIKAQMEFNSSDKIGEAILSERSLSALGDSLPQSVWRNLGLELGFTSDQITTIFEQAELSRSDPRFELLRTWKASSVHEDLVLELVEAFLELGRTDVAELLQRVQKEGRGLRRGDFSEKSSLQRVSRAQLSFKRLGQFIYPDI